ncbi:heme peroxidase [Daedalea quercina L-15889]|uniref:Heme peroxidase n=1 Tax=Daedalea quercina L-15889 TaxID=1314783 RepID=A0A165LSH8_9APHY|nr:heme peroxidase [Daedalea quercina L-15889]
MSKIVQRGLATVRRVVDDFADSAAPLNQDGASPTPSLLSRKITDVQQVLTRGPALTLSDLPACLDAAKSLRGGSTGLDDRKFLLEDLLTIMARAPDDSLAAQQLEKFVIQILYKDLPHPPSGFLTLPRGVGAPGAAGQNPVKYTFRSADGSNYNVLLPSLGMAGAPYARSVPSTNPLPPQYLPDPGLVFDTLLKRDAFVEHPSGLSALFFAFANIVIHSIFNTNARDWTVNDASSYLDLSPLYGSAQAEVDAGRRKDGTGRLWEDVFADRRLLFMPPSTCALLVLFCRNHNFVAERIRALNERGTFADPATLDAAARGAQDDELFARARLVNTAFFMKVVLGDYVGAILGLTRDGLAWRLDPLAAMRELDHAFAPQGEGNVVSAEFNLMYRWHATSSQQDTAWIDALFQRMFDGKSGAEVTVDEFKTAAIKLMMGAPKDVREWSFDDLKRDPDGRYADADLAKILLDATEAPAGAFKARGTPDVLRIVEILGIMQSRSWGTCSLNEFRSFIGLRPYKTFAEWNPDPAIHRAAESLYHDIDHLELHVGLQAEQAKVPMPGAGLCPGYTISRAMLADAVCLTRGDRFLTVDFTPFNLTSWGYQDCMYDAHDGSCGGILSRLLFRTLPEWYPAASAYALFPFVVPARMREFVTKTPDVPVARYDWARPAGPVPARALGAVPVQAFVSLNGNGNGNGNGVNGYAGAEGRVQSILGGTLPDVSSVERALLNDVAIAGQSRSLGDITKKLIDGRSIEHVGSEAKYLNVVRDVVNVLPAVWAANDIIGLPLKTETNPNGIYRLQELVDMFRSVASYVYHEAPAAKELEVHERAKRAADLLVQHVKEHLSDANGHSLNGLADSALNLAVGRNEHERPFLQTLLAASQGSTRDALAAGVFTELVPTAMPFSRALCQVVDYYLSDERQARFSELLSRAREPNPDFDAAIAEALDGSQQYAEHYHTGLMHPKLFSKAALHVLQAVFGLTNIRKAPGSSGLLHRIADPNDGDKIRYLDTNGQLTPWPVSLIVEQKSGNTTWKSTEPAGAMEICRSAEDRSLVHG